MLSEEFAKRGADFMKLMALANVLEEEKVQACNKLIRFIKSLTDDFDGYQNYVKWAINLPQIKPTPYLFIWILGVVVHLLWRPAFRTVESRKVGEFMTWLIHQPEPFGDLAGKILGRLWRLNEELVALFRKEALLASLALMESCLQTLINEELDVADLAKLFLASARGVRWRAVMMVSRFSIYFKGNDEIKLKRLIS